MAVEPFLKYVGGKRWLAKRIIERMPPHVCYVEPFGGMGAVLLAKDNSKVEVWNDIDGGLANVMRIVRHHPQALADELQWMLLHRAERQHWQTCGGETDIQRAARWIMVRHTGFGGMPDSGFQISRKSSIKPVTRLVEQMRAVSERLASVVIECMPWQRVLELYDAPETLFYCDPPYADGDQTVYGDAAFREEDHRALAERLFGLRGQWILSYGDHPLIRELYAACHIEEVRRVRTISQSAKREYVELVITP